eukprot:s2571_g9.t1
MQLFVVYHNVDHQDQTSALASTLRNLFVSPELPPELQVFPQQVAEVLKPGPETYTGDLSASAVVMANKMLQLEGQLGAAVQSSWVPKLQLALARQREQEAELEKEVHLARLHLRRLAQDVAETKLRRQELEEEQAEFVPFATKESNSLGHQLGQPPVSIQEELEDAMQQMAKNRRAPERWGAQLQSPAIGIQFDTQETCGQSSCSAQAACNSTKLWQNLRGTILVGFKTVSKHGHHCAKLIVGSMGAVSSRLTFTGAAASVAKACHRPFLGTQEMSNL